MIESRKRQRIVATKIVERRSKTGEKRYKVRIGKRATLEEFRQALGISKRDVEEVRTVLAEVVGH